MRCEEDGAWVVGADSDPQHAAGEIALGGDVGVREIQKTRLGVVLKLVFRLEQLARWTPRSRYGRIGVVARGELDQRIGLAIGRREGAETIRDIAKQLPRVCTDLESDLVERAAKLSSRRR